MKLIIYPLLGALVIEALHPNAKPHTHEERPSTQPLRMPRVIAASTANAMVDPGPIFWTEHSS